MSRVKKLNLRVRYVFLEGFGAWRDEEGVILAPDRQQRRLRLAEIFLEFGIKLHIRCVIQEQVELNVFIAGALEQRRIQRVRLRRNTLGIRRAKRVLPTRSFCCQNAVAEYVSVLCSRLCPILSDRPPGV